MLEGSFLTSKLGPMPTWAWMAVGLGGAIAFKAWEGNKAKAAQNGTTDPNGVQLIGGDQAPPVVFQSYTTVNTPVTVPPGHGREHPPVAPPPATTPTPAPAPTPTPAPVAPPPARAPAPSAPPPPAQPAGQWVTVAKWAAHNPPWNSTVSGIAAHYGKGNNWGSVWNAPANAALKQRRKQPNLIQPGDRIFVPA